jgi:7-dehydrocholesterol reductase
VQCFVLTGVVFAATWRLGWFEPASVYDHFGEILSALNLMSLSVCALLWLKVCVREMCGLKD